MGWACRLCMPCISNSKPTEKEKFYWSSPEGEKDGHLLFNNYFCYYYFYMFMSVT